jgi:hypothetical protein
MKRTYLDSFNKKAVRDFLIDQFTFNEVVGLPGPDINEYLQYFQDRGVQKFEMYELDRLTLINQLRRLRTSAMVSLKCGDILSAEPNKEGVLYDLDFCRTARYLKDHIAKFKQNFIMTFSRRITDFETITTFLEARKERIIKTVEKIAPLKHTVFTTNAGEYILVNYHDTSNMCCIAKIN